MKKGGGWGLGAVQGSREASQELVQLLRKKMMVVELERRWWLWCREMDGF